MDRILAMIMLAYLGLSTLAATAQEHPKIDTSGKGAVLCGYQILTMVQAVVQFCELPPLPMDLELDVAINDIEAFVINNSSAPISQQQLDEARQNKTARYRNTDLCTGLLERNLPEHSELGDMALFVNAIRQQDPADFAAGIKNMLSVPREPLMNPCL